MAPRLGEARAAALIFPTHDGDEWKLHDWQNWRRRVYQPAAKKAGVTGDLRVYRLRESFVSLLLWEGRSQLRCAQFVRTPEISARACPGGSASTRRRSLVRAQYRPSQ